MAVSQYQIRSVKLRIAGVISLVTVLGGCAFGLDKPADPFKRSILIAENGHLPGSIGIVPAQYPPDLRLQTPAKQWLFRAEKGAVAAGKDTFKKGMQYFTYIPCNGGGRGCGVVALIGLTWFSVVATGSTVAAGVSAVQGGIEGAKAEPDSVTLEKADEIARNALGALQAQESMAGSLEVVMRNWVVGGSSVPQIQKFATVGPVSSKDDCRYGVLGKEGIDVAIETTVQTLKYEGYEDDKSVNPSLRLSMTVLAKVVRVSDGSIVYSGLYEYESGQHAFEEWISGDGSYLVSELDRGYKSIAQKIAFNLL